MISSDSSNLLLLCKTTHEWLIPFVYTSATLTHPRALLRLAKTLSAHPTRGQYLRKLWVGPPSFTAISFFKSKSPSSPRPSRTTFFRSLHRVLSLSPSLLSLSLVHIPLISLSQWSLIESTLPKSLETLVMGPDHAMLGSPKFYPSLKHLVSIETTLVHVELNNIRAFPNLELLEWVFVSPHTEKVDGDHTYSSEETSPIHLEWKVPEKFGEKLLALLHSNSLRHVRIVHLSPSPCSSTYPVPFPFPNPPSTTPITDPENEEEDQPTTTSHNGNSNSHDDAVGWTMNTEASFRSYQLLNEKSQLGKGDSRTSSIERNDADVFYPKEGSSSPAGSASSGGGGRVYQITRRISVNLVPTTVQA